MSIINNNNQDIQQRLYKKVSYLRVEKLVREASDNFAYFSDYAIALDQINAALEIEPDHVKALVLKGNILFYLNERTEAMVYFNKAISLDSGCAEAYGALAGTLDILGKQHDALYYCEKAFQNLSEKDNHLLPSLYDQKIAILVSMKRFEQARESLNNCVRALPEEDGNYLVSCYQTLIDNSCKEKQRKRKMASKIDLKVVV